MSRKHSPASESSMSHLHYMICEYFIGLIQAAKDAELDLAPTDVSNILRFLKDNDITAMPDNDQMDTIRKEFDEGMDDARAEKRQAILALVKGRDDNSDDPLANIIQ